MARDKSKDDNLFDCSDYDEKYYVAKQYDDFDGVMEFLEEKCNNAEIYHSTHEKVYQLIEDKLGYKKS